jgi:hypothetical protein
LLRNAFACLALAIGFAGLAFRSRSSIPLLAELQLGWERQKNLRMGSHRGARPGEADPDYLQELIKQAEAEDSPPTGPLR